MGKRRPERALDLSHVALDDDVEVLEPMSEELAEPPPLRLFAGLDEPAEVPFARHAEDRIGSVRLWRAISSL